MAKQSDVLPVKSIDLVNPTQIFELGTMAKVTTAMVDIQEVSDGFMLFSKNPASKGFYKIFKQGVKGARYQPLEQDEG